MSSPIQRPVWTRDVPQVSSGQKQRDDDLEAPLLDRAEQSRRDGRRSSSSNMLRDVCLVLGGVVIIGALVWLIVLSVMLSNHKHKTTVMVPTTAQPPSHDLPSGAQDCKNDNAVSKPPKGAVLREVDQCVFSHKKLLDAIDKYKHYVYNYGDCAAWGWSALEWDKFTGANPFPEWDYEGSDAARAGDAAHAGLVDLVYGKSSKLVTDQERMMLHTMIARLGFYHNMSRVHHYHTMFFDVTWAMAYSPTDCNYLHASLLPLFANEPDYAPKALAYMNNTLATFKRMNDYFPKAINAGIVAFSLSAVRTWQEWWRWDTLPGILNPICNSLSGADKTTCQTINAQYEQEALTFRSMVVNQYLPACTALRGLDAPGLALLPNGTAAALIHVGYLYGDATEADIVEWSTDNVRHDEWNVAQIQALLSALYPGLTVNDWIQKLGNMSDPDTWLCSSKPADILSMLNEQLNPNITRFMSREFGYQSRERDHTRLLVPQPGQIVSAAGRRNRGYYDRTSMLWINQGHIEIVAPRHPQTQQVCMRAFDYGLMVHENMHSVHVGLTYITCHGDLSEWTDSFGSPFEGIAVYGELALLSKHPASGLSATSDVSASDHFLPNTFNLYTACPRCYLGALDVDRMAFVNSMYNFQFFGNMTWQQCMDAHAAVGVIPSAAYSSCYRSASSLQRTVYFPAAQLLWNLRQQAQAALGLAFNVLHFNKLLLKMGPMAPNWWPHLVDTYIEWRKANPVAKKMFGYDYITRWIFGNTEAACWGADQLGVIDNVYSTSVGAASAARARAAQINAAVEARMATDKTFAERMTLLKRRKDLVRE